MSELPNTVWGKVHTSSKPLDKQVGGTHYKDLKSQPIFVCEAAAKVGGFSLGNVFKYLCRYPYKGKPMEDLQKVDHYIELYHWRSHTLIRDASNEELQRLSHEVWKFINENNIVYVHQQLLSTALHCVYLQDFTMLHSQLEKVINSQEKQNG